MADNKLLAKRDSGEDFLAEDDPLAELSRLVGFDPAPVAKVNQPAQRREPAFDLEDELLRELEIYQQPAAPGTSFAPAYVPVQAPEPQLAPTAAAPQPAIQPEPDVGSGPEFRPEPDVQPVPVRQPVILEAVETFSDPSGEHVYERPAAHPVFDLEDEILREFSAFDARRVTPSEEHPVAAEVIHQDPPAVEPVVPAELHDVPDGRLAFAPGGRGRDIYQSFRGDDLDEAISNALVPETVAVEPATAAEPVAADIADVEAVAQQPDAFSVAALRPLDDSFWSSPVSDAVADQVPAAEPVAQEIAANPGFDQSDEASAVQSSFVEPAVDDDVAQENALVSRDISDTVRATPVAAHDRAPAQPVAAMDSSQDDLLEEVDTYPIPDNMPRWRVVSKRVAAEDVAKAAPPVVHDLPAPAPEVRPEEATAAASGSTFSSVADPVIDEGAFDIDLGDIELELSDLNEGSISASPDLLADLASQTIPAREEPVVARTARSVDTDYSSLPFDPSQITQEDETFEAIAEMNVPDVPVVHEEEKPAPHPEYDIDLDAEMAQLFVTATAQSAASQRSGQSAEAPTAGEGAGLRGPAAGLDLDDFERALEEDFRRSFAENRASSTPDRVSLEPVYVQDAPSRSRRSWVLLASAAVAIAVFGGAGVYAYMAGDVMIANPDGPKVILADTDPVKVVPEDPGGKQVPNQNKAVYDRVSGEKVARASQPSLVTSNEEPVDVVQRTLMPETLPMDDDGLAAATPTGDTIDPRLLPDEEEQDRVTTTNKVVSGVSPRKVKTMVVRPDGTLVEREVTEEDLKQQATNDAELMRIAQKAAQDAATASDSQGDDIAKAIESVPERLSASEETALKPSDVPAKAVPVEEIKTDANVDKTAESRVADLPLVQPVVIEDEEPVVAERPADAAARPVTTSEARPEPVAAEEKPLEAAADIKPDEALTEARPVETLAEKPVDIAAQSRPVETGAEEPVERAITVNQPSDNSGAMATAADIEVAGEEPVDAPVRKVKTTKITPVPEVRPVDQPVDIVGTVTDQGTVRSSTDARPAEVALADPAQKPAETAALPAGSYVIQIASLPSEAEAQTSYDRLSAKFAGIIGGKGVDIRRADIKNKGTYYRVRIPAGSRQDAQALCSQYKAAGGSCLVSR